MKKWTAALLALCMLLAAVPALGEGEDVSGDWYANIVDVTAGTLTLNADGTASLEVLDPTGAPMNADGEWTFADGVVTMTVEGSSAEFTLTDGSLNADWFPLPFTRTKGKLTRLQAVTLINGGEIELPEGVTQEEAEACAADYAAYMKADEPEEPELSILRESFKVVESYNGYRGVYIAKVQNNTGSPFYITGGTLTMKDAEGNAVGEAKYLSQCGSKYLEPGEISFISIEADVNEGATVADFEKTVSVSDRGYGTDVTLPVTDPEYKIGMYDNYFLRATVTNDTDEARPNINMVLVAEDAEGDLLLLCTASLYYYELGAGSTITLVNSVDSRTQKYFEENGITPVAVEAYAYYQIND